jgi:hypothetical protein
MKFFLIGPFELVIGNRVIGGLVLKNSSLKINPSISQKQVTVCRRCYAYHAQSHTKQGYSVKLCLKVIATLLRLTRQSLQYFTPGRPVTASGSEPARQKICSA